MITVVIPTYNRGSALEDTIRRLLGQETDFPYEIIVVDNNSSDSTGDLVRSFSGVRYVHEPQQGLCRARNRGIAASAGEIVAMIDDDALPEANWLTQLRRVYLEHPDAKCVGGKIVLAFPGPLPQWFSPDLMQYLSGLDLGADTVRLALPSEIYGANFSFLREAVETFGGFRTDLDRAGANLLCGGDTEFCWRLLHAGASVYYCGSAVVTHVVSPSRMRPGFFTRRAYWGGRTARLLGTEAPSLRQVLTVVGWLAARALLRRQLAPDLLLREKMRIWSCVGYLRQAVGTTSPDRRFLPQS